MRNKVCIVRSMSMPMHLQPTATCLAYLKLCDPQSSECSFLVHSSRTSC